ncbi:MAG: NAD-dependent epimerase/dehydratase family protein, partial [Mycobacterium sp.]|nr:NAD-dependent epimerase/dehydratase family protein [Mycobacterium sp.]
MRLLVLGGSRFLGRAIVEAAIASGIDITCFRRGTTTLRQPVHLVRGDRTCRADVAQLAAAGHWDAVIDTAAYIPGEVRDLAIALKPVVGRYVLISTVAAYKQWPAEPTSEQSPLYECPPDAHQEDVTYGALKAGCETAVREVFGADRTAILRPGAILGPHDYLGRLPWWLRRIERGGRVLAPGNPERTIQPIDVRDVAEFAIRTAARLSGTFNVAGSGRDTMSDLLVACRVVTASDAELEWVTDEKWLAAQGLKPWTDLPLWRIERGVWQVDCTRAQQAGLRARPILDTVESTWEWLDS